MIDAAQLARLEAEVDLLEAELALAQGDPFRRQLYPWESGSAFAEIDREVQSIGRVLTGLLDEHRVAFVELVEAELARQPSAEAVVRRAMAMDANGPLSVPGAVELLTRHEDELRELLREAPEVGAASVIREAAASGVDLPRAPVAGQLAADVDVAAIRLAYGPPADALRAVREEAARVTITDTAAQVTDELVSTAVGLSTAPLADYARTAASNLYGRGRVEEAAQAGVPQRIYASELLDTNTCSPCATVDGTEYDDLAAARQDYPDGYYRACEGGVRCRGTLVFVWPEEAQATR